MVDKKLDSFKNKLSFISSVKNEEKFIKVCIDSIFKASLPPSWSIEVVVIDDNSTDSTFHILTKLSKIYKNLKFKKNTINGKVSGFNEAFQTSTGSLIFIFGGDDIIPNDSILKRISSLENYCKENHFDLNNDPLAQYSKLKTTSDFNKWNNRVLPPSYSKRGNKSGATTFMNRKAALKVFPIPPILVAEDLWTFLTLDSFAKTYHLPLITYIYRVHKNNSRPLNRTFQSNRKFFLDRYCVYGIFLKKYSQILDSEK